MVFRWVTLAMLLFGLMPPSWASIPDDAFGTRNLEYGDNSDVQRANTKDEDPTGLLNEGFRYRDLETGVFLTRDPAGFVDGPNLYTYVRQNPWTAFDPHGLAHVDPNEGFNGHITNKDKMKDAAANTGGVADWNVVKDIAQTSGEIGGSMITGVGEAMDIAVLTDPSSSTLEKVIAGVSLGVNTITGGILPNAGGVIRGGKRLANEGVSSSAKATGEAAEAVADASDSTFKGGPHKDMIKPAGDGLDSHHMPDRGADPNISSADGTAIQMDPADHRATSSYGGGRAAGEYRAQNADMISKGQGRNVMAREIKDVRSAANQVSGNRTKYNKAIKEMLDYSRSSGQLPSK